jgi:hypothetical protein
MATDPGSLQAALADPASALQGLINLIVVPANPYQNPLQPNAADFNYLQIRDAVLVLQNAIQGNPSGGVLSYEQVKEYVKDTAPKLGQIQVALTNLDARVDSVTQVVEPVLFRADEKLKQLELQSVQLQQQEVSMNAQLGDVKKVVTEQLTMQTSRHDDIIKHAAVKFTEFEEGQKTVVEAARVKFGELAALQSSFETQVADKVKDLDMKLAEVSRVYELLKGVSQSDAADARAKMSQNFGSQDRRTPFKKEISEYKAITALERFSGDDRVGYKSWLSKLKNSLDQARGKEWRIILNKLENCSLSDDFEELTSLDEKWDDWFETEFGQRRLDGSTPIDLLEFKSDIVWILTDKLPENMCELIRKYEQNGLRAYKKLYTWSQDLSSAAKEKNMGSIMNPTRATRDEELANCIEKWDRDQVELAKADPRCVLYMPFKLLAFKNLCPQKLLDHIDTQLNTQTLEDYDEVRKLVYRWALKRRLEATGKGSGGNGLNEMDIPSHLPNQGPPPCCNPTWTGNAQPDPGNWDPSWEWGGGSGGQYDPAGYDWGMDALGKGKGAWKGGKGGKAGKGSKGGKGTFTGTCYNCGKVGHRANECRSNPKGGKGGGKGKGKGKGKGNKGGQFNEFSQEQSWNYGGQLNPVAEFQGYCYNCNQWGHSSRNCPTGKGGAAAGGNTGPGQGAEPLAAVDPAKQPAAGPGKGTGLGSLDLGGGMQQQTVQGEQPLRANFEGAGWKVRDTRGRARPKYPNVSAVLECMALDEIAAVEATPNPALSAIASSGLDANQRGPAPQGKVWKEIKMTMDSGACDHVINPEAVNPASVRVNEAVTKGVTYYTASGHPLPNLGEIQVVGQTTDGQAMNMVMQVAGVKKPLASVRKICSAGCRVVFEETGEDVGGYVEHKVTGARANFNKEGGTYQMSVWALQDEVPRSRYAETTRFEAIAGIDEDSDADIEDEDYPELPRLSPPNPAQHGGASSSFRRPA